MQPNPSTTSSCVAVWAPWLAAPLFALLPIGGCGLAGGLRPAAAQAPAATVTALVPAAPVMTVVTAVVPAMASVRTAH
ncbi:MAG: hypothetical protein ACKOSQ_01650 [Planctomycetaceae bacterium]